MHYGVKLEDFNLLWQEAIREESGRYAERTENDRAEQEFWAAYLEKKQSFRQDEYAVKIARVVKSILRKVKPDSILEIGPGWGNYTFDLAGICSRLTCVDISRDVLDYILRIAGQKKITNIQTVHSKWEDYDAGEKADVVFGYNCFYRMKDLRECLRKINHMAGKLCVIGMTSGPEQPYLKDFEKELGLSVRYHRFDYIYFTNLLYQMGIDVNCSMIPLVREYAYETLEKAMEKETDRIKDPCYDGREVKRILERYYKYENGKYRFHHQFNAAILFWDKQRQIQYK